MADTVATYKYLLPRLNTHTHTQFFFILSLSLCAFTFLIRVMHATVIHLPPPPPVPVLSSSPSEEEEEVLLIRAHPQGSIHTAVSRSFETRKTRLPVPYRVILDLLGCPTKTHRVSVATGCGLFITDFLHTQCEILSWRIFVCVVLLFNNVLIDTSKDPHHRDGGEIECVQERQRREEGEGW